MAITADLDPITDDGLMLAEPVVIAGDGPRADIGLASDLSIAQIGQMIGFGASTERRLLDFNEIPDMDILFEVSAWPQVREGAENSAAFDLCIVDDDVLSNQDSIADTGVP